MESPEGCGRRAVVQPHPVDIETVVKIMRELLEESDRFILAGFQIEAAVARDQSTGEDYQCVLKDFLSLLLGQEKEKFSI